MNISGNSVTPLEAAELAIKYYGISGTVKKLIGEVDYNFYIKDKNGLEYTLKISRPDTEQQIIELQTAVIKHLAKKSFPLNFPKLILTSGGGDSIHLENNRFLRLYKWVPGKLMETVNPRSKVILENWGETCGLISLYLKDFEHSAAKRFYSWNPSELQHSKKYRQYITKQEHLELCDYFWKLFETMALPYLPALRKSVNYNDAHEKNLLVDYKESTPSVTGIIDFGDVLYTETINELAIACAYAGMNLPDPLRAMCDVVKGYHKIFPLQVKETEVLFPLITARLMLTVTNAALNKQLEPENEYLTVSENAAWESLKKLRVIHPNFANYVFRAACGMTPCTKIIEFNRWITENNRSLHPIMNFGGKKMIPLDLSVSSKDLGINSNFECIRQFSKTIHNILTEKTAEIGIGGYCEIRPFYSTDAYKTVGNEGVQWRTVHMGTDVWTQFGEPVYAPMDGIIHSLKNNEGDRDYGPTVILEHKAIEDLSFYTLYGHLDVKTLEGKEAGDPVKNGEIIGNIGKPPENGNWPPHLHFQIILDMLGNEGDYPAVFYPHETEIWKSICPDSSGFFPAFENPATRLLSGDILDRRREKLGKSLSLSYNHPLHIVRGYKQHLYDNTARRYLDTVNNVAHVGHQHPRLVRVLQQQIELLNTNTRYLHEGIVLFAEELLATFPSELSAVYFVNSGSEANELALRMMRTYTGHKDIIAVENGYHGNTGNCIDISHYKFNGKGGGGKSEFTHIVPMPDTYRGIYQNEVHAGDKYAAHVKQVIEQVRSKGRNIGGFICESILSCGGQIVLPDYYLKEAYRHVRSAGGLCIADEVQVGFGRTGDCFWGFQLQDVIPDIVTMGKPIGNGHPLAAVVTTQKIADTFSNGMEYFNTFGGNPVSCAVGREVLQIVQDENLQYLAKKTGDYLKNELSQFGSRFPIIGDVRGHGLFLGIELVNPNDGTLPLAEAASYIANRMCERGILMSTDGPDQNVMKIKPPMCFGKKDCDFLLENLEIVLNENAVSDPDMLTSK